MNVVEIEDQHAVALYARRGIQLVKGEGVFLFDSEGRKYIDCMSGQGVMNIGHGHPKWIAALETQSKLLASCPMSFHSAIRSEYLSRLLSKAPHPLNRAFLCNSGAESIEAAIKFARLASGKRRIVSFMRGFHGRTMGALSSTFNPKYKKPFAPLVPEFVSCPFNKLEKLQQQLETGEVAAVILELVQGEGGVHVADPEFVTSVRRLCSEHSALFIVDEVQSGFGRTGRFFATEHFDVEPDMLCLAKAIAGGFPMGATLVTEDIALKLSNHGSTFGGNPLACACGLACLEIMEGEHFVENSAEIGSFMLDELRAIQSDSVREVRGLGLMIGLELKSKVQPLLESLASQGVLALSAGPTVLRFLPPLCLNREQAEMVIAATHAAIRQC